LLKVVHVVRSILAPDFHLSIRKPQQQATTTAASNDVNDLNESART